MTRWMNSWLVILVSVAVLGSVASCGRDQLGALLVRWPF